MTSFMKVTYKKSFRFRLSSTGSGHLACSLFLSYKTDHFPQKKIKWGAEAPLILHCSNGKMSHVGDSRSYVENYRYQHK